METRLAMRMYQEYTDFFKKAERERRWNVFEDIPWDKINKSAERRARALRGDVLRRRDVPARLRGRRHQRGAKVVRTSVVPGQLGLRGVEARALAHRVPLAQRQAHRRADGRLSEQDLRQGVGASVQHAAADDALRRASRRWRRSSST